VNVGDLVTVRLEETGVTRFLLPGLIINKFVNEDQRIMSSKIMYEILARGEVVVVSNQDLGPIDLLPNRERLERKWNNS
jgi:hypothetical protein